MGENSMAAEYLAFDSVIGIKRKMGFLLNIDTYWPVDCELVGKMCHLVIRRHDSNLVGWVAEFGSFTASEKHRELSFHSRNDLLENTLKSIDAYNNNSTTDDQNHFLDTTVISCKTKFKLIKKAKKYENQATTNYLCFLKQSN